MGVEIRYRGKIYREQDVETIRELIERNPGASRYSLSKELCRLWGWTQANGSPKDMVCRGLMLLLDREGLITLPVKKRELPWLAVPRSAPQPRAVDTTPVAGPLSPRLPLDLAMVRRTASERLYQSLIASITISAIRSPSANTSNISPSPTTGRSRVSASHPLPATSA